ncbi:hypothetical protein EOD41_17645 [Mucilaginibacter limnophilus]|uniref:DUF4185 domain-containing protein n=1 Tax=Mucilaginibacter limnophilus TaxID=1932778 RepID=A0A437MKR2_9SPHI|nr:hypothetical protein [Mucilaginibacter limnophilus]RVT98196.1 hypothetical protein EOD41_17645 [Mucilaginibacter limnophilus]
MKRPLLYLSAIAIVAIAGCKKESSPSTKANATKLKAAATPATAAYLDTTVTNFFRRETGHIASDGGSSIPLSNGKVLWLMGDSHIDDYRASDGTIPYLFQVRNAALLQPKGDWNWRNTQTLIGNGNNPKSYLKNTDDTKKWIWPGSGIEVKGNLYVYCGYLQQTNTGFGFEAAPRDLWAKIQLSDMKVLFYVELPDFKGINFGLSFIKDPNSDYVYVFGNKMTFIYNDIFLARFKATTEPPVWEFYDGKDFSKDINKIKRVGEAMSSGCHVAQVGSQFVIVSTEFSVGCDQGKRIYISTSGSPRGPYTPNRAIYTITDTVENHYPFFYAPVLHPEYINEKNEVLLTYAINGYPGCLPDHVNFRSDPDRYRLRGVRIPYSVIAAR